VTFSKEAAPLGYFKMIDNRMVDSAAVGNVEEAQALGNDYPYGIVAQSVDPEIWIGAKEPPEHAKYIAALRQFTHEQNPPSFAIQGYITINALADGITKAGSTNSDAVSKALIGMAFDTPVGKRTFSVKSHETFPPEFYGVMVKEAAYPFAVMKDPELLPKSFTPTN
jgi:branched-chain amino acid transport system substrate-binding protein